jgi:cell division protein ZapA (FtsZ GTPase activity inhibitor)
MKNSCKLLIFGDHYSVVSDESQSQLAHAASMVDSLMKEISAKVPHIDEKRIAVLTALQLASKIIALESQIEHTSLRHKELVDRIEHECIALLRS